LFFVVIVNGVSSFSQTFADSLLNIKGGIYSSSLEVKIKKDSVQVFYTIDGTVPSSASNLLNGSLKITKTTVVRFKAYSKGKVIGQTTQTYIIGRTFDMPVVSIAVNPDDFFGFERGIYVKGCCAAEIQPYLGANFWKNWEREINIEFFEPDGTLGFNQKAGVKIFGGFSKGWPMKSLAIIARDKYGSNRFKHKIFPNKDIKKFKSFILRNSGGDFNKTHFRDALITDLVEPLDMEIQAYRPAVVYINGEYWGIHNIREKITEHYISSNCGVDKDSVDLLRHRGDVQNGDSKEYKKFIAFLNANTFESSEKIQELNSWMDIDNYINYNIAEVYCDNRDAGGNIRYWRERKEGAKWRWIFYDTDLSFGISDWKAYNVNTLKQMTSANTEIWPNPAWSTFIIRKLLENDSLKQVYSNRFADHLNTIFRPDNVIFKIDSIQNLIRNEMPYHIVKWPSLSLKTWERNVQVLRDFATYRAAAMRGFIIEKFGWSDTIYVGLGDFDNKGGVVKFNSLLLKSSFYGWYFSGCPITIEAIPNIGYDFVKWEGLNSTNSKIYIDPTDIDSVFYPVFKKKVESNYSKYIKINEISCKQDSTRDYGDWIEFYNLNVESIDLSNWTIVNNKNDYFTIPEGTVINKNDFLIVAKSPKKISEYFPDLDQKKVLQEKMKLKISAKDERIFIYDSEGNMVDSLVYDLKQTLTNFDQLEAITLSKFNPENESVIEQFELTQNPTPGSINANFVENKMNQPFGTLDFIRSNIVVILSAIGGGVLLIVSLLLIIKVRKNKKLKKDSE
jgi:hypothetical protein